MVYDTRPHGQQLRRLAGNNASTPSPMLGGLEDLHSILE